MRVRVPPGSLLQKFDDVHDDQPNAITHQQASEIARFITEGKDKNIFVNCHAGVCRSGAIVEILLALGWKQLDNDFAEQRIPNTTVFHKIRKQFPELLQSWKHNE